LRSEHFGGAAVGRLLVVELVAVQEHHDVGVLLERSRFTKVGEHRSLLRT